MYERVNVTKFREGVVLLREPFRLNRKLVRETLARADVREKGSSMVTTHKQRAHKWLSDNLVKASGQRAETLEDAFAEVEHDALIRIAKWLNGLETVLVREIQCTGDPQLTARRGIYEGIAAEVLGGNWRSAR